MAATHFETDGSTSCGRNTQCGQRVLLLTTTDSRAVTCKRCLHTLNAPKFVGASRGRNQYALVCTGGPWNGKEAVFARQESSPLSIVIRVGEHVGQYNLNTGEWVPKEKTE